MTENFTRAEWEDVVNGPGKFEGQPPYVPYFWDLGLSGSADEDNGVTFKFVVTEDDRELFPELEIGQVLYFAEDDCGFVFETVGRYGEQEQEQEQEEQSDL